MRILLNVSLSDNAANFYNLANANRNQIKREYMLLGSWYNKEMGLKDVFYQRITTYKATRETHSFSASFSSLFAIKVRGSNIDPRVLLSSFYTASYGLLILTPLI